MRTINYIDPENSTGTGNSYNSNGLIGEDKNFNDRVIFNVCSVRREPFSIYYNIS